MTEKEHHAGHGHHHHEKGAETDPNSQKGSAVGDSAGGPSSTSETSTNAQADQVGDQGAPVASEKDAADSDDGNALNTF